MLVFHENDAPKVLYFSLLGNFNLIVFYRNSHGETKLFKELVAETAITVPTEQAWSR